MTIENVKRCSGYVKQHNLQPHYHPTYDFHKDKSQKDGLAIRCKPCQKIVNALNNKMHNPRNNSDPKYDSIRTVPNLSLIHISEPTRPY